MKLIALLGLSLSVCQTYGHLLARHLMMDSLVDGERSVYYFNISHFKSLDCECLFMLTHGMFRQASLEENNLFGIFFPLHGRWRRGVKGTGTENNFNKKQNQVKQYIFRYRMTFCIMTNVRVCVHVCYMCSGKIFA